jgi:hypothetical protein
MPRKPLPENASKLWSIGPEALVRRPEHAAAIGRCLGLWTDVELQMAIVLAVLLKANTEAAIAVYLILRRGSARSDAIMAAAKATLDKKDQELISAVLTVHKSVEAERNSLAHGCWGTCNKIPDAVLWVDLADNANFIADYFSKEPGKSRTFSGREHADFAKKLFYYTLDDLEDVYKQIYKAEKMIFTLVRYLRLSENPPDGRAREDIYDQLCNLAPIRAALLAMRARAQRNIP